MTARSLATALALGAVLVMTACSGQEPLPGATVAAPAPTSGRTAADGTDETTSDILYLQRMSRFDEQADALSDLALHRTTNEQLRALATAGQEARRATRQRITEALTRLGSAPPVARSTDGLGWAGILTPAQLAAVDGASDFDDVWLAAVIQVDREAVTLSTDAMHRGVESAAHDVAVAEITLLTDEYQEASRLAGPGVSRSALPG